MEQPRSVMVALGLGANLDEPRKAVAEALRLLAEGGLGDLRLAPLFLTEPVNCNPDTPPFVNTAVSGRWSGTPSDLLRLCQGIETQLGRPVCHSSRDARIIDLDILLMETQVIATPTLSVPHPRLTERLFALVPLAAIAAEWPIPPGLRSVEAWRDQALGTAGAETWGSPL